MFDTFLLYDSDGDDILIIGVSTVLAVLALSQFSAYSSSVHESFLDKPFSLKLRINTIRFSYFSFTIRYCVDICLHDYIRGTIPDFWRGEGGGCGQNGNKVSSTRLLHSCESIFNTKYI